ncbi:DEAD/DEAH box helicase family protein [Desulfotomaculum sp. 1211_IL3151]|uniref:DEAD/DEAH box helicase family protein n=1 Tax=Desulfotomaculum sp. 1211_IL3151 TaxID=3084055 RepID=UPI002FD9A27B
MTIDFNKFRRKPVEPREINPMNIYDGLALSGGLNDLWRGQFLALQEWHESREEAHSIVNLNTGGGKTIIGLLQGQSIVNETNGKVFYLCGSIQLVKQTAEMAESIGLKVATYYNSMFINEVDFNKGEVICITTYQALFNGKSRFTYEKINALIFDDAHVASHVIRDQFTITLKEQEYPETYATIVSSVKEYFKGIHAFQLFDQVVNQKNDPSILLIPFFVWQDIYKKVTDVLVHEGVHEKKSTKFSWDYLRDHLDLCAVLITSYSVEITPFLPPLQILNFMNKRTRKIFLSATIQDEPGFVRTFGFKPSNKIAPKTRAGESERLIITSYNNKYLGEDELFEFIADYSKTKKVLVIPNSERRAKRWREYELKFSSEDFSDRVIQFKNAREGILVAPARFEGMDFPNEACRILVMDGLPSGTGLIEKFQWNNLGETKSLQGTIASRIVQSLGRISRGNDDYGLVFLMGNDLADWITRSDNRSKIPLFIQAQLDLGERITEGLNGNKGLGEFIHSVLSRDKGWIDLHQDEVKNFSNNFTAVDDSNKEIDMVSVALEERKFIEKLWNRDYLKAANALEENLAKLFITDKGLAAWHCHWIGYCYLKIGNTKTAEIYFNRAAKSFKSLGVIPKEIHNVVSSVLIPDQESPVGRIIKLLTERGEINYGAFSQMDERLAPLFVAEKVSSNLYEDTLKWLGCYLGFQSNRPDKDSGIGRGPDNFWLSDKIAIMIESKEDKTGKTPYSKKEVGQSLVHLNWIKEEYPDNPEIEWKLMIAGPDIEAAPAASTSEELNIWLPDEILSLASRVRNLLRDTWRESTPATFAKDLEKNLTEAKLTDKDIFNSLPNRPMRKSNQD